MDGAMSSSDGSDCDDLLEDSWSLNKRKKLKSASSSCSEVIPNCEVKDFLESRYEKFNELQAKSSAIMLGSAKKRLKTEERRSKKLLKKALRDPEVKAMVGNEPVTIGDQTENADHTKWKDVKPYLSINDHLQGPVSHGDCGPKTELEYMIEDCIKDGDFEKAEVLSDTLANREFAVKIAHAFSAKKYQEKLDEQKAIEKTKQSKKIRGLFEAKEKWQMKGNM